MFDCRTQWNTIQQIVHNHSVEKFAARRNKDYGITLASKQSRSQGALSSFESTLGARLTSKILLLIFNTTLAKFQVYPKFQAAVLSLLKLLDTVV